MVNYNNSYTFDVATLLKDAGLIKTDGAAQVGGAAAVVNLGAAYAEGVVVIDVTAIEVDTASDLYNIILQGSADAAFTAPVNLGMVQLGHTTALAGGSATSTTGRYYLRFQNERNGVIYPYIRIYNDVDATALATGINYSAWIGKTGEAS